MTHHLGGVCSWLAALSGQGEAMCIKGDAAVRNRMNCALYSEYARWLAEPAHRGAEEGAGT